MSKMLTGSIFILILLGSLIGFDDVLSYFILGIFLPSFFVASLLFGIAVPTFSLMAISLELSIHTRHGDVIGTLLFIFFAFGFLIFEAIIEGYVGSSAPKIPLFYQLVYFLSPVDYFGLIVSSFEHGISAFSGVLTFLPSNYVPLLGVVVAGGSEYGENWHLDGIRDKKINVFNDFFSIIKEIYNGPAIIDSKERMGIYIREKDVNRLASYGIEIPQQAG